MSGKRQLVKSLTALDTLKQNNPVEFPGILGVQFKGQSLVEVPNRDGYVYVRLRSNLNEIVQAYNSVVSPVFGLPVILVRDNTKNRYIIKGRDLGQYGDWGNSAYMAHHAGQHSFTDNGWGGDIVWVYGRQFMPLLVTPASGSTAGGNYVTVYPYVYYLDGIWDYVGGVSTPNLLTYCPTGTGGSNPVLIYLDENGDVQVLPGSNFNASYTTIDLILPYLPALPNSSCVPLAAVRLSSGTTAISWNELYDLRPLLDWWSGVSGSSGGGGGHVIQNEGTPLANRINLNFIGSDVLAVDDPVNNATNIIVSGSSSSGCFVCTADNTYGGQGALASLALGVGDTAIGVDSLLANIDGNDNTGIGNVVLSQNEGSDNTGAGSGAGNSLLTGSGNTFLGRLAGLNVLQKTDASNSMALGYEAYTTKDNQVVIGNDSITETLLKGTVVISGDLDHDGTNIGFFGATGTAQSTGWSITNDAPDKVLDCNSTSLDELADVIGTLINELKLKGLLGA